MDSRRVGRGAVPAAVQPHLNSIEAMFSKVEEFFLAAKARKFDTLIKAVGDALRSVEAADNLGWFAHRGDQPIGSIVTGKRKLLRTLTAFPAGELS